MDNISFTRQTRKFFFSDKNSCAWYFKKTVQSDVSFLQLSLNFILFSKFRSTSLMLETEIVALLLQGTFFLSVLSDPYYICPYLGTVILQFSVNLNNGPLLRLHLCLWECSAYKFMFIYFLYIIFLFLVIVNPKRPPGLLKDNYILRP